MDQGGNALAQACNELSMACKMLNISLPMIVWRDGRDTVTARCKFPDAADMCCGIELRSLPSLMFERSIRDIFVDQEIGG